MNNLKKLKNNDISEVTDGEWGERFLRPLTSSASIAYKMENSTHISQTELIHGMERLVEALAKNDLKTIEEILFPQAVALQTIFDKASKQMLLADSFNGLQAWATIAFKAQDQSRKTLSTLMAIRRPQQTSFIKQQNNAVNQQVNNYPNAFGSENSEL